MPDTTEQGWNIKLMRNIGSIVFIVIGITIMSVIVLLAKMGILVSKFGIFGLFIIGLFITVGGVIRLITDLKQ
jgi:hypothetical protein